MFLQIKTDVKTPGNISGLKDSPSNGHVALSSLIYVIRTQWLCQEYWCICSSCILVSVGKESDVSQSAPAAFWDLGCCASHITEASALWHLVSWHAVKTHHFFSFNRPRIHWLMYVYMWAVVFPGEQSSSTALLLLLAKSKHSHLLWCCFFGSVISLGLIN